MNDQIDIWCQAICQRTGTCRNFFIDDLRRLGPNTIDEAEAFMGTLLYNAWHDHDSYVQMWDTTLHVEEIV